MPRDGLINGLMPMQPMQPMQPGATAQPQPETFTIGGISGWQRDPRDPPYTGRLNAYQQQFDPNVGYTVSPTVWGRPMGFMSPANTWMGNGGWGASRGYGGGMSAAPSGFGSDSDAHGASGGISRGGLW
jgi:hypothetical protein